MNEADWIAALRALPLHDGAVGLTDDAALLPPDLVLTSDTIAQDVHFPAHTAPQDVAWRLVATNLSDLAAKGARPEGVLLSYPLGDDDWDRAFLAGLREVLRTYRTPLLGGDTIRQPAGSGRVLGLTAIGRATHLPLPRRAGSRPGDGLWLVGTIGDAMLGHRLFADGELQPAALVSAYLRPQPLLREGQALAPLVSAMMDVSDGLLIDSGRLAGASGVTLSIDPTRVPRSADFRAIATPADQDASLRWGDDYALLFTLPPDRHPNVPAIRIGEVQPHAGVPLLVDGAPPKGNLGYQH